MSIINLSRVTRVTPCDTTIAIFVSHLLSLGHTGQEVAEIVRLAEAAFKNPTSKTTVNKREKDRLRQAAWRANRAAKCSVLSQDVTRDVTRDTCQDSFLSLEVTKTLTPIKKKESKEVGERENTRASVTLVTRDKAGQNDGLVDDWWPDDYLEIFWGKFPPYRRQAKRKVGEKLARLRREKKVTWNALIAAVEKFAETNPEEFAPAPLVWLNGERWDREYGGARNGKTSHALGGVSGISAHLRRVVAQEGWFDDDAPGGEPIHGR